MDGRYPERRLPESEQQHSQFPADREFLVWAFRPVLHQQSAVYHDRRENRFLGLLATQAVEGRAFGSALCFMAASRDYQDVRPAHDRLVGRSLATQSARTASPKYQPGQTGSAGVCILKAA